MASDDSEHRSDLSLSLHAMDPTRLDQDALASGVAAAVAILPGRDLRIVVSGDFETYVREHGEQLPELPPYVQGRVRGYAVAKILQLTDGGVEMLIDASAVDVDRDSEDDPERVFAHEALHLMISDRCESTGDRRARLGYELGSTAGAFAGMAGHAGEEFRIERALRELGHPLGASYRRELPAVAAAYADSLRDPFWDYQHSLDLDALGDLSEAAVVGFEHLAPVLAYLIGDDVGAGVFDPPPAVPSGPVGWFRDGYQLLYEPLAALPAATTPCSLQDLDRLLDPVGTALEDWLASIGFRWSGGPDEYSLHLLDPERLAQEIA